MKTKHFGDTVPILPTHVLIEQLTEQVNRLTFELSRDLTDKQREIKEQLLTNYQLAINRTKQRQLKYLL